MVLHDTLVGPAGEHLVQNGLEPRAVNSRGGIDELLDSGSSFSSAVGSVWMPAGGCVPAMIAAAAALGDQPSSTNRRIDRNRRSAASS